VDHAVGREPKIFAAANGLDLESQPLKVDAIDGPKYLMHAAVAQVLLGQFRDAASVVAAR
jgi:hypothetical protein